MPETESVEVRVPMDSVQADAAQDQQGKELSELMNDQKENSQEEPGWLKGRINAAVSKAVSEAEARIRAEYEQRYAPMQEQMLETQAQKLVADGTIKDLEMAREYLRFKNGNQTAPAPEKPETQEEDPKISARADLLARQASKIVNQRGVDVMDMYNKDPEIQRRINSGEWDFYDVLDSVSDSRRAPAPVRSSNNGGHREVSIRDMTDAQWKELNKAIDKGVKFRA